jgi:acetyl esterase/lipase
MVLAFLASILSVCQFLFVWTFKSLFWLLGFLVFALWYLQGRLLYMPAAGAADDEKRGAAHNEEGFRSPGDYNLPFDDVKLQTRDGVALHAWFLPSQQQSHEEAATILFFHGNAGNIGTRLPNARMLAHAVGCAAL